MERERVKERGKGRKINSGGEGRFGQRGEKGKVIMG